MMRKPSRLPPGDDGHTIASMDIDGMPPRRERNKVPPARSATPTETLSKRDALRYTMSAVGAGLLIVAVFGIVFALFLLFSVHVWFGR